MFGKHQHNNNINNINNNNIIIIINHKTKQHISTTQWKWKTKHLIYSASCFLKRPSYTASPIMRKNTNWQMRVPGTSASGWLDALKISKTWRLLMPGFMKPAVMCTNNYDCSWGCASDNELILALCIIKNKKKKKKKKKKNLLQVEQNAIVLPIIHTNFHSIVSILLWCLNKHNLAIINISRLLSKLLFQW